MKAIRDYWGAVSFSLGSAFKFAPRLTVFIGLLFVVGSLFSYLDSYLLGKLVDGIIAGASSGAYRYVYYLLFIYAAVDVMPHLLSNLRRYVMRHWRYKVSREIELMILKKREQIDIANYESPTFQDLIQRAFRNGLGPIANLTESQFNILLNLSSFVVGTFLVIQFSPLIYIIVIATAIPGFVIDTRHASRGWSIWAKDSPEQRRFADLRQHIISRTPLIETKLVQSGEKLLNWMRKILTDFAEKQLASEKSRLWSATITDLIAFIGMTAGLLLVVRGILQGEAEIGTIVYMLGVISRVRRSVNELLNQVSTSYEDALIVADIKQVMETPNIVPEASEPLRLNLDSAPEIKFDRVGFKYPNSDKWILRNISLTMKPGDKIGLVGNNGAGKTTLVKLLCRIYDPSEGRILVNGTDLREVAINEWWSYLGVMFQDYATYDFKVKEAIAIGRPQERLSISRVKNAAELSQAVTFIKEWKGNYDHQLGVEFGGTEPSKGQRQKLSIAKVIYRNAFVMILDEPTASVDAESEAKIFDSLEKLSKETTALLISHDFSTILQCNQIFVLERGKLIESGSHEELMVENGKYAELYNLQAERFKK